MPSPAAIRELRAVVDEQAEDDALWCETSSIVEAYLQQELRRLHSIVEAHRIECWAKDEDDEPAGFALTTLREACEVLLEAIDRMHTSKGCSLSINVQHSIRAVRALLPSPYPPPLNPNDAWGGGTDA